MRPLKLRLVVATARSPSPRMPMQDYLDQILPGLLPLVATLCIFFSIKRGIKTPVIILGIIAVGFALGVLGVIAL